MTKFKPVMNLNMKKEPRVVCIGNFDGVHRGHQALLTHALGISPHVIVLSFEPHPRQVFASDGPPFRITTPAQKNDLLRRFGAREIITLPFSPEFAAIEAETFITEVIRKMTKADHVVVGDDFHFGHKRSGNTDTLRQHEQAGRYELHVVPEVATDGGERFSSTRIREALQAGDIDLVNRLLGWRYDMTAEVVHGDARGREIGFPTANQSLGERLPPGYGVYASWVHIDGERHMGATNIGIRPMFRADRPLVETHILGFSGDLYGKMLTVEPVAKLRDEARYDSLDALVEQIRKDCAAARELLVSRGHDDQ